MEGKNEEQKLDEDIKCETESPEEQTINGEMDDLVKDIRNSGNVILIKNMNFLKNNSGIVFGDEVDVENLEIGKEKKKFSVSNDRGKYSSKETILETEETLIQWLTNHYNDFEMAFLLALTVFDRSPYVWVYEMAEELFSLFDIGKEERQEKQREKKKMPGKRRIETVGAGLYTSILYNHMGAVECEFIRFIEPESSFMVLKCVWQEFIFIREILISWLKSYVSGKNHSKNFSKAERSVSALGHLARLDYYYFDKHVISGFLNDRNVMSDFAVAQIMIQAYEDERYKNNIETQMKHWATLGNFHYSLVALMVSTMGSWDGVYVHHAVKTYLKQVMDELQEGKTNGYMLNLSVFFEVGCRKAVYFKSIVSVLYERLVASKERKYLTENKWIGLIFLLLLQIDYDQSYIDITNPQKNKDMIFVRMCFIDNDMKPKLLQLWKYIWKNRPFHKYTQRFLEQYIYQYGGYSEEQIQYLRQFLYSFQDTEADCKEMEFFLRKITFQNKRPVKPAERINYQLDYKNT